MTRETMARGHPLSMRVFRHLYFLWGNRQRSHTDFFIRDRDHRRTVIDMFGDLRPHFDQQTRQSLPLESFEALANH